MSQPLKFRVLIPPLCAGIALLVGTGAASAQATAMQSAAKVSSADKAFVDKAASGGMAEIEMSKLAQQKASNDQVKQFGTHMVDDHTHAADELKQVATSKGLTLPSDIDAQHKSKMARLEKLSGAQFDRAYMDDMVADHKAVVAEFAKQAKSGSDADLKSFASKTLPTLQEHLTMAESTDRAVKNGK